MAVMKLDSALYMTRLQHPIFSFISCLLLIPEKSVKMNFIYICASVNGLEMFHVSAYIVDFEWEHL